MPTIVQAINQLDSAATALANFRARPILVMYYPPRASVTEYDINYAYKELRDGGVAKEQPLTYGGDPVAGYRVAQVLRSMCNEMDVLVPEHAYSAGTLTSFCGDEIRLGDFAGLSPIDITITEPGSDGVQLAGLDSFLQFAHEARAKSEEMLKDLQRKEATSRVDSDLLVQMVKEIGALTVGRYYRERTLTGHYAQILLENYMFKKASDRKSRAGSVVSHFLFGAPSHEFHLDYRFCLDWHLNVSQMSTEESDLGKAVVSKLRHCTETGLICQRLDHRSRMPFVRFYRPVKRRRNARSGTQTRRTGNAKTTS